MTIMDITLDRNRSQH